jgi:alcohol dehydrogenase class IV
MENWNYHLPTKIIFGINSLKKIKEIVDEYSSKKILLVTGRSSMKKLGVTDRIKELLNDYEIVVFDEIEPNPSVETVEKGLKFCGEHDFQMVIGLGGGSAMDAAKAIAILKNNKGDVIDYLDKKKTIKKRGLPFIAICTTSGTASEITRYSVITDTKKRIKKVLYHDFMHPDVAIIDPDLTKTMPKNVTASTGMDALAHSVESYWSIKAQPITEMFALKSIELVYKNLVKACDNLDDMESRINMSKASLFAGLAFDYTGTNVLHSLSYPFTSSFDIPHGHACALTMTEFMKFNQDVVEEKISNISRITGVESIEQGIQNVQKMLEDTGLPMRLSKLGIKEKDVDTIIEDGFNPVKMGLNPKKVTKDDLRKILMNVF